jgi:hypothetical protein
MIFDGIMGAVLIRLVFAFEMKQVKGTRLPNTDMVDFSDKYGLVIVPRSYDRASVVRGEKRPKNILTD